VKELLKSVYICQSYCKNKSGTLFWDAAYNQSESKSKNVYIICFLDPTEILLATITSTWSQVLV